MHNSDGDRMNGRMPYAWDRDSIAEQIACTWRLLEKSESRFVVLLGSPVRQQFVNEYGDFENGDSKHILSRE